MSLCSLTRLEEYSWSCITNNNRLTSIATRCCLIFFSLLDYDDDDDRKRINKLRPLLNNSLMGFFYQNTILFLLLLLLLLSINSSSLYAVKLTDVYNFWEKNTTMSINANKWLYDCARRRNLVEHEEKIDIDLGTTIFVWSECEIFLRLRIVLFFYKSHSREKK